MNELQQLANLLHLLHHRNKNQHRRGIWWRHFSTFRKRLRQLLADSRSLHQVPTTHLERHHKAARDDGVKRSISQRLALWRDVLVPKWHHAFSQVVADGRFAVLGLVLLAGLAQACAILGVTVEMEALAREEVEKGLPRCRGEASTELSRGLSDGAIDGGEDVGEAVVREGKATLVDEVVLSDRSLASTSDPPPVVKPNRGVSRRASPTLVADKPRKKKKKANAIDDLFSKLA